MRDRTRLRRWRPEREQIRAEHQVRRDWGKFRLHTRRLAGLRARGEGCWAPGASGSSGVLPAMPARPPSRPPAPQPAGRHTPTSSPSPAPLTATAPGSVAPGASAALQVAVLSSSASRSSRPGSSPVRPAPVPQPAAPLTSTTERAAAPSARPVHPGLTPPPPVAPASARPLPPHRRQLPLEGRPLLSDRQRAPFEGWPFLADRQRLLLVGWAFLVSRRRLPHGGRTLPREGRSAPAVSARRLSALLLGLSARSALTRGSSDRGMRMLIGSTEMSETASVLPRMTNCALHSAESRGSAPWPAVMYPGPCQAAKMSSGVGRHPRDGSWRRLHVSSGAAADGILA